MPKFYTAFLYKPNSTSPHCTHKYFGEQPLENLLAIAQVINIFNPASCKAPVAIFDKVETFGKPESPVRVLTTPDRQAFAPFDFLRATLDAFNKDDFEFNPHITTSLEPAVDFEFSHYALCTGRTVIFAWPLKGKNQ